MLVLFNSLLIILIMINLNYSFPKLFHQNIESDFIGVVSRNAKLILNDTIQNYSLPISDKCRNSLNYTYIQQDHADYYIYKTIEDSSKNKNDVGSYNDCMINKFSKNPNSTCQAKFFSYMIVSIDQEVMYNRTDSRYESGSYLFGLCVARGCNETEYIDIFYDVNIRMDNLLTFSSKKEISMYNVNKNKKISWYVLLDLIPFYFLIVQIVFLIFPEIPSFLFRCCFKKKGMNKSENSGKDRLILGGKTEYSKDSINAKLAEDNMSEFDDRKNPSRIKSKNSFNSSVKNSFNYYNKNKLFNFNSSFNVVENGEELFSKKPTNFNNESGLHYLKGVRGICMMYLIIGNTFLCLFNTPVKIYEEKSFTELHQRIPYSNIFFGIRYAPRILFSCSGFSFIYKLLSFVEEKEDASNNNTDSIKSKQLKFCTFLRFMLKQTHKYILYVLVILIYRFSIFYIIYFTSEVGPLTVYFKLKQLDKIEWYDLVGHLFLFQPYIPDSDCHLDFFWMSLNEITFFIISTLLIWIFYSRKWRFDIILLLILVGIIATKYILFCFPISNYYPTVFYYYNFFGTFSTNPLYNYSFYIIGIFFGLINYSIQNNITKIKDAIDNQKSYLICAIKFIKIFNGRSKIFYIIISFLSYVTIIVFSNVIQVSLNIIGTKDHLKPFYENFYLNLWLILDTELVVFLVNFIAFCLFIMGENIFFNIISHTFWLSFSRSYFTYILINNPLIICFLYQSQSRVQLDFVNVFFYSVTFWLLNVLVCWVVYISIEFPWKRINKLILEEKSEEDPMESYDGNNLAD